MKRLAVLLSSMMGALPAAAHPGHGTTSPFTVMHYVVEPVHGAVLVVLVALMVAAAVVRRRTERRA